jgi:hypothetical protein
VPPIHELEVPDFACVKLGRRNISAEEAEQLPLNRYRMGPNPRSPHGRARQLLVGETNGGRRLELVIEPTEEPTTWRVITGWDL